ncbi:hypothetical protein [Burkholderia pseudomallei]|uniref:hypothetical protein n=1 Tax=Burkholderia pseudomallei TaxID=28450 RepID=UPI000A1A0F43|nr:hypothetical protein [Burkholderia pseudomallei]ARK86039.1 hypothetical protein BOC42_00265 [Burkholderia pseudomallei]ARL91025.1 hypothetical protein BOC57_35210 [Burkholderia pseudomallei]
MKKIVAAIAICFASLSAIAAKAPSVHVTKQANWEAIEAGDASNGSYSYTLYYKADPESMAQAEGNSAIVIRAVLRELMKEKVLPTEDHIFVSVNVVRRGLKGETGKPLSVWYGTTYYDSYTDQIKWKPQGN